MADMPLADITADFDTVTSLAALARPLVEDPPPGDPVWIVDGWDCSLWRWGEHLALRLPRREVTATAVRNEQTWLPVLAPAVQRVGVRLPVPLVAGSPTARFPWPWSVVPWIEGDCALTQPRSDRSAWAAVLAETVAALHTPADAGAPHNPYRGVPLMQRHDGVRANLDALGGFDSDAAVILGRLWQAGLDAHPWVAAPVWIHGDLHPANLVVREGRLTGVIDFCDLTAGDPAYDLAVAWLAFDPIGRAVFRSRLDHDEATWTRARAWAAAIGVMLLVHSDDAPDYRSLGREIVHELRREP